MVPEPMPDEVLSFVGANIDSVPQLEALLLIWDSAPREWTTAEIAHRVYLPDERAARLLQDLAARRWVVAGGAGYAFNAASTDAPMIAHLAAHYRSNLIRIAEIIHRKASPAVLDFARAFDLRKDR
jgi:DNA-binding IclR family transcriptional regulator